MAGYVKANSLERSHDETIFWRACYNSTVEYSRMSKKKITNFNLQSFLDSHDNPFVLIDDNYTILGVNRAYCTYYDTSPSEVIGSKCHMAHHGSEFPCPSHGEKCPMRMVMETGNKCEVNHLHHNREFYAECVCIKGYLIVDEDGNRYLGEEIIGEEIGQTAVTPGAAIQNSKRSTAAATEAKYIARLMEEHHGNRRKVAEILSISERMLGRKLRSYNLTDNG